MSALFYQKYRRLFFEDDTEPLAYQIYHSQVKHGASSDVLPQWLAASPPRLPPEPLPKPSKVRLPPIDYSPPPPLTRKVPAAEVPKPHRQLSPLIPAIDQLDQPRRPMLQYEPMKNDPVEIRPSEKPAEYVPKPSIKVMPKTDDTRERLFPKGPSAAPSLSPYQIAVQRRKDAKRNIDSRREALRRILKV